MLKNAQTYEIMRPADIGLAESTLAEWRTMVEVPLRCAYGHCCLTHQTPLAEQQQEQLLEQYTEDPLPGNPHQQKSHQLAVQHHHRHLRWGQEERQAQKRLQEWAPQQEETQQEKQQSYSFLDSCGDSQKVVGCPSSVWGKEDQA